MRVRYAFALLACWLAAAGQAAAEPVTTFRSNGNSANRFDLVILGDGYTSADIASGKYANDVEAFVQLMFAQEPYREYQAFFNVHRVDVTSAESGADHPERSPAVSRDTALDSTYNCGGMQRLICVNLTKVNAVLAQTALSTTARDQVVVFVNDSEYGGSGGSVAVASTHPQVVELILHELGHSFGLLTDEYGGTPTCSSGFEPGAVNATGKTERAQIKWAHWIDPATPLPTPGTTLGVPGLYHGAAYCDTGLYRPTFDSKMRSLGRAFEQINTEQLIKRIYNWVSPIDAFAPLASAIDVPAGQSLNFSVSVPAPRTHNLDVVWKLDGVTVGAASALTLTGALLGSGTHQLVVTVHDGTALVRSDPSNVLRATRSWTITVTGNTVILSRQTLSFAGTNTAGILSPISSPQDVAVTFAGTGTTTWTAAADQPWVQISGVPGSGSGRFSVGIVNPSNVLGASTNVSATVTLTATSAGNSPVTLTVNLTLRQVTSFAAPFGSIDTPADGSTGVTGSIGVTGWALDDVEVRQVRVMRDPVAGEGPSPVFIGNAVRLEGARPDVATLNPTAPGNTRAGWGYLMLTNFLPNQGNGTFKLYAYADDADGHTTLLGSRTITCTNSTATRPFGAIDTPGQGEVTSGAAYSNFGWVLARGPALAYPPSGTVRVLVDGVFLPGAPGGWVSRSDLTAVFPADTYPGVTNALGVAALDTTTLSNGVHTIAWVVTASNMETDGIGSRYFSVFNGSALQASPDAAGLADISEVEALPLELTAIVGRRGFDIAAPFRSYAVQDGRATVHGEELDRFELHLGQAGATGTYRGYQRIAGDLAPLPIGSHLDPVAGVFTWQPGVGFVHAYDLVFVRCPESPAACVRREVRFVLHPKGSNRVGPQVVIDTPRPGLSASGPYVQQPLVVAGWAIDRDADVGTGVDTLHVWAYPVTGDAIFLGAATYGGARPDVAALFGDRFTNSGYGIVIDGLPSGTYDVAVFAWSTAASGFVPASVVRVAIR